MKFELHFYESNGYLKISLENIEELYGNKKMLELWLTDDVAGYTMMLENIDKAIAGNPEYREISGNLCKVIIEPDYTEIHCLFEKETSELKPCKLPTKLLREIVAVWLEEYEKYSNSKK